MTRNSLAFAPATTNRRTAALIDKSGRGYTVTDQPPQPGDRVLVEHNQILQLGIQQQDGSARLDNGGTVKTEKAVVVK